MLIFYCGTPKAFYITIFGHNTQVFTTTSRAYPQPFRDFFKITHRSLDIPLIRHSMDKPRICPKSIK